MITALIIYTLAHIGTITAPPVIINGLAIAAIAETAAAKASSTKTPNEIEHERMKRDF